MRKRNVIILAHVLVIAVGVWAFWPRGEGGGTNSAGGEPMVYRGILGAKIRGLDPAGIGDTTSSGIGGNIFECLFQYELLDDGVLKPCLAEEMPTVENGGVSDDGKVFTIKIKKGVLFQDDPCFPNGKGRELTAEDFVYSWKRVADLNNNSQNWSFLADRIVGLNEFRDYTAGEEDPDYDRLVEGLKALDKYTLRIELTKRLPQVLYVLAHLPTAAVAREAVACYGDEIAGHPVGTGPFRLLKWKRGFGVILERNPSWRGETYPYPDEGQPPEPDAGKPIPFVDRAEYRIIEEAQPAWLTFLSGESDISGIPKDFFSQTIKNERLSDDMVEKGIKLITAPDPSVFYLGFNMEDPVVGKNKPLRQAISLAINRDEYIQVFLNGRGIPANGPIPPTFPSYDPDYKNPYSRFDLDLAVEKLREAEKIHGGPIPTLVMDFGGADSTTRKMGEYYTNALAKIGLELSPEYNTWPKFQDKIKSKACQVFTLGWVADYPDAENFLFLFYGQNVSPGPNSANYVNPEFDALFEKATMMFDSPERRAEYRKLAQMVVEDCPWVFLLHPKGYTLYYDWVKNIHVNHFASGTLKYRRIVVDLQKRTSGTP